MKQTILFTCQIFGIPCTPAIGCCPKISNPRPTKNGCVSISHKGEFPTYSSLFVRYEEKHDPSPESTIQSIQKPILTLAILALAAPIALVWATGSFDPRPASADIASYYVECPQTSVREGSRVEVYLNRVTNHTHTSLFFGKYTTVEDTAAPDDYVERDGHRDWTNNAERDANRSWHSVKIRQDVETFTLKLGGKVNDPDDPDRDTECEFTILYDDPNITKVEVTSEPARESNTYGVGEVIEISATFSNRVEVADGGNPRLGLRVGDTWKQVQYLRGSDSRVLVFGYRVKADDEDTDGIRMPGGYKDSGGQWHNFPGYEAITHRWSDRVVYRAFEGFDDDEDHKVDGSLAPIATRVAIISTRRPAIPTALGRPSRSPSHSAQPWRSTGAAISTCDPDPPTIPSGEAGFTAGVPAPTPWCLHTTSCHATWILTA